MHLLSCCNVGCLLTEQLHQIAYAIWVWLTEAWLAGMAKSVNIEHIKMHYFTSHPKLKYAPAAHGPWHASVLERLTVPFRPDNCTRQVKSQSRMLRSCWHACYALHTAVRALSTSGLHGVEMLLCAVTTPSCLLAHHTGGRSLTIVESSYVPFPIPLVHLVPRSSGVQQQLRTSML